MSSEGVEVDSHGALMAVCRRLGYEGRNAVLLREGTNAVYRVGPASVIVRVAPVGADETAIRRQIGVARWLAAADVPAVRLVDVLQPIQAAGRLVTVWESVGDGDASDQSQYGNTSELGSALRRLHRLPLPANLELPQLEPVDRIERRVERLSHLVPADHAFLADRGAELSARYRELSFALEAGPIHGDANVGNLLRTRDGGAVLADLDSFATGPREWDLVLTAMFADRYGWHTEAEYRAFVEAYGYDLREWAGYEVLADVRELLMVLWNAGNAATSEEHARELRKRLESLRTGRGRDEWTPL